MLDCVERAQPVGAEIAAAHGRERHRGRHRDAADPDDDRKHMERAGEGEIIHDRRLLPKIDRRCTPFARAKVALAQTRARRGDYAAAMARIRFEDDAIEVDARVIAEGLRTTPERVVAEMQSGRLNARCVLGIDEEAGTYRLALFPGRSGETT